MSEQLTVQRFFSTGDLRTFPPNPGRTVFAVLDRPDFCKIFLFKPQSAKPDDDCNVIQPTIQECCLATRGRWEVCYNSKLQGGGGAPSIEAHAATVIVDQAGNGDATTIADGIAALPAGGGLVFVREGTYTLAAALVFPDAPIAIVGTGRSSVKLDVAANIISCFETAFDRDILIRDMTIVGTGSVDQTFFKITAAFSAFGRTMRFENINVGQGGSAGVHTLFDVPATGRYAFKATNCLFDLGFNALSFLHKGAADTDLIFTDVALRGDLRIEDHIRNFDWQNLITEPVLTAPNSRPTDAWTIGTVRWQGIALSTSTCTGLTITGTGNLPNTISNSNVAINILGFIVFPGSMNISNSLITGVSVTFGDDCTMTGGFLRSSPTALAFGRRVRFANIQIQATIATPGAGAGEDFLITNCNIAPPTTVVGAAVTIAAGDIEGVFSACHFQWIGAATVGIRSSADKLNVIGCTFAPLSAMTAILEILAGNNDVISSCIFEASATTRLIDITAGANNGVISGCNLKNFATDAIRTGADGWHVYGNPNALVAETGAANFNHYSDIVATSTITGASSRVNGTVRRAVDPAVGDDNTAGFFPGDRWINTVSTDAFIQISNGTGAAVWKNMTAGGGGGAPSPHLLGGVHHTADTKAALDTKVSDASLFSTRPAEISAVADKPVPVAADHMLIEDSAAANAKKRASVAAIRGTPFDPQNVFVYSMMNGLM